MFLVSCISVINRLLLPSRLFSSSRLQLLLRTWNQPENGCNIRYRKRRFSSRQLFLTVRFFQIFSRLIRDSSLLISASFLICSSSNKSASVLIFLASSSSPSFTSSTSSSLEEASSSIFLFLFFLFSACSFNFCL